jgi:uncharacterized protein YbjT (DUF2867 family)
MLPRLLSALPVKGEIAWSGLEYNFLRPNLYMQGLLGFSHTIRDKGGSYARAGDAAIVDIGDIAAAVASALVEKGHGGKTFTITGPEAMTHQNLHEATGRKIEYVDVAPEVVREALQGMGISLWQADESWKTTLITAAATPPRYQATSKRLPVDRHGHSPSSQRKFTKVRLMAPALDAEDNSASAKRR